MGEHLANIGEYVLKTEYGKLDKTMGTITYG
jgi:hypothetical protein